VFYKFSIETHNREELTDITHLVQRALEESDVVSGIVIVYTPHTTSAITINENADPDVRKDILHFLNEKIPQKWEFNHSEGNADAHIKSSLLGCSQTLIIEHGQLLLGTWQGVYFCEFDGPRKRNFFVKIVGN